MATAFRSTQNIDKVLRLVDSKKVKVRESKIANAIGNGQKK